MRRPVDAERAPTVKASRVPVIVTTIRKRKRFGDNTGIGSCFSTLNYQINLCQITKFSCVKLPNKSSPNYQIFFG